MPSYGIEIHNATGDIQITQDYANYQLIAQGTIGSATSNSIPVQLTYPAQANNTIPLVFVRPHSDGVYVGGCLFDSSAPGLTGFGAGAWVVCSGAFDYKIYGITSTIAVDASGFGLQVFDTSGNPTYDSRKSVPRIQDVVVVNTIYPAPATSAYPFAPYDSPVVPISKSYTSFGQRPWFMVNNLQNIEYAGGQGIWACAIDPTANTSKLIISDGDTDASGNWFSYTSTGASPGYTQGFAGGQCIIPLAICY
jgi:hypothetical protein